MTGSTFGDPVLETITVTARTVFAEGIPSAFTGQVLGVGTGQPLAVVAEIARPVVDEVLDEVVVSTARALDQAGNVQDVIRLGNMVGTGPELIAQMGPEAFEVLVNTAEQVEREIAEVIISAQRTGRSYMSVETMLRVNGIRDALERIAALGFEVIDNQIVPIAARLVQALPEVVVTGTRIATGTPMGLATLVLEAAARGADYLSDLAFRNQLRRFGFGSETETETELEPLPVVTVTTSPDTRSPLVAPVDIPTVTITAPRRLPFAPFNPLLDLLVRPLSLPNPNPFTSPFTPPSPLSDPQMEARPLPQPRPTPTSFLTPSQGGVPQSPEVKRSSRDCPPCGEKKKKKKEKKKRKPRAICYAGAYRERALSLTKRKREVIPCT